MTHAPKSDRQNNEGEGNRTFDRKYRDNVRRHVESGASDAAAEEAERAMDGDEADELRKAEEEGREGRDTR